MGFTCGGFLDQIIKYKGAYPEWIDHYNLRFLYRLIKEPKRLWRRYLIEYQVFLYRYWCLRWNLLKSKLSSNRSWDKPK
jgi:N-acetylglucosaminyldiphosphoundecaprenol N-acetyl-beta-D-mannosaminyltransferase